MHHNPIKLYDYYRSSASFRVRIALNIKNLAYDTIPVHLLNQGGEQFLPTYRQLNPHSLVPTLDDGGKVLTQSLAIIEYLEELHPEPALLPQDPYHKALCRAFALSIAADMHPINNLRVLTYLTQELGLSEEKKMQWYYHWMQKGLAALETQLVSSPFLGKCCVGDTPTLADICLVPQLYNARRFQCDLSAYPTLVRVDAHCQTVASFIKAWPETKEKSV